MTCNDMVLLILKLLATLLCSVLHTLTHAHMHTLRLTLVMVMNDPDMNHN